MYRNSSTILLLVALALLFPKTVHAQYRDLGGLTSIELSKNITPELDINFGEELRFNHEFSNFDRAKTFVELDYTLLRRLLKANVEYDYMYTNKLNRYEHRHRLAMGLTLQQRYNSVRIRLRSKAQSTWRDNSHGDYAYNPKWIWRNKLTLDHNFKNMGLRPYVSGEIFIPLNGKKSMIITDYRAVTGVKYRLSKPTTLDFFLRYDQEIQQKKPQGILYGGVGLSYSL